MRKVAIKIVEAKPKHTNLRKALKESIRLGRIYAFAITKPSNVIEINLDSQGVAEMK